MNIIWGIIYENSFAGELCLVWVEAEHLYTCGWKFLWMIHTYQAGITVDMASLETGMSNLRKHWALWWILSQGWTHWAVREVVLGASKTWLFRNRQSLLRLRGPGLKHPLLSLTSELQPLPKTPCPTGGDGSFQDQWQVMLCHIPSTWSSTILKLWL